MPDEYQMMVVSTLGANPKHHLPGKQIAPVLLPVAAQMVADEGPLVLWCTHRCPSQ